MRDQRISALAAAINGWSLGEGLLKLPQSDL
jgi:hypothetical protein